MAFRTVLTLLLAFCFISPCIMQAVNASFVTDDTKDIEHIIFNNAEPGLFNSILDLDDNATDDYNNFNYTEIGSLWGDGKYIYPLTPPLYASIPENQTYISFAQIFSLSERTFSGACDMWVRLPFNRDPGISAPYPNTTLWDTGNYTVKIYQLTTGLSNITDLSAGDVEFSYHYGDMIFNRSYSGDGVTDEEYYRGQQLITSEGKYIYFTWLRVSCHLSSLSKYVFFVNWSMGSQDKPMVLYLTEGDSWGDNKAQCWLNTSSNDTIYLPFDLDISVFIREVPHNGLVSVLIEGDAFYRGRIDFNGISTNTYPNYNFVVPVSVDDDNLTIETKVYYTAAAPATYYNYTGAIDGESFIYFTFNVSAGLTLDYVNIVISSNNSHNFLLYLVDSTRGYGWLESGLFASQIYNNTDTAYIFQSSMSLYGYASWDDFKLVQTRFNPILIPFNSTGSPQEDTELIGVTMMIITARLEENIAHETYMLRLRERLKIQLGVALFPLKIIDLALEGLVWVTSSLVKWLRDDWGAAQYLPGWASKLADFIGWIKGAIRWAIGFMIDIAKLVIKYLSYTIYMLSKFIGLFMAILIGILILNGVDAIGRGMKKYNFLEELSKEWTFTQSVLVLMFVILGWIFNIIWGMVNAIIPF